MLYDMGYDMMLYLYDYDCYIIQISPVLRRVSDPDEPISR